MSEEREPQRPLDYWSSTDHTPTRFRLALAFIAGCLTSIIVVIIIGGICGFSLLDAKPGESKALTKGAAITFGGCFIVSIVWFFKYRKVQRELPPESRLQPPRYFELGMLIGFGVAALLEGLCFGAASVSQ